MKELKSLNKFLLRYKWRLILGVFFIICANWFNLYPAQIFRNAIDVVVETINTHRVKTESKLQPEIIDELAKALLIFAGLLLAVALI